MLVSADPIADLSHVTLGNSSDLVAGGTLAFDLTLVDITQMAVLDASNLAFSAVLTHLASNETVACIVMYAAFSEQHEGNCELPKLVCDVGALSGAIACEQSPPIGEFSLDVKDAQGMLLGATRYPFIVNNCSDSYYKRDGKCVLCPDDVTCFAGSSIPDWELAKGYWRASEQSRTVFRCRYGVISCPGPIEEIANSTERRLSPNDLPASCERDESSYCDCGYTGPLCSECGGASDVERYYLSWETQSCASCGDSGSHTVTISLLGSLGALFVLATVLYFMRKRQTRNQANSELDEPAIKYTGETSWLSLIARAKKVGKVKLSIILYTCQVWLPRCPTSIISPFRRTLHLTHTSCLRIQVVSQFASVVTTTSENATSSSSSGYSSSATNFAAGLSLSNLDLIAFVPVSCLFPATSFYDALLFKTLSPLVVLALLWTIPMYQWITGKSTTHVRRTAAKWSLFLLEFIAASVSTTVTQTFECDEYDDDDGADPDDDLYLRAELTLACDGSTKRRLFLAYGWCMMLVYPVGEERTRSFVVTISV